MPYIPISTRHSPIYDPIPHNKLLKKYLYTISFKNLFSFLVKFGLSRCFVISVYFPT